MATLGQIEVINDHLDTLLGAQYFADKVVGTGLEGDRFLKPGTGVPDAIAASIKQTTAWYGSVPRMTWMVGDDPKDMESAMMSKIKGIAIRSDFDLLDAANLISQYKL